MDDDLHTPLDPDDSLLPVFSRGASSPLAGKRTVLAKTFLTDQVAEDMRRRALELGYTTVSDYLRDLVEVHLYGPEHLASLRRQQLDALAQNRPRTGPEPDLAP